MKSLYGEVRRRGKEKRFPGVALLRGASRLRDAGRPQRPARLPTWTLACVATLAAVTHAEVLSTVEARLPLLPDGTVPVWLVAGPFEQPTTGFGVPVDTDLIGEAGLRPFESKKEESPMASGGSVEWFLQSPDTSGFLDFNATVGWAEPGRAPQKVWFDHVAYASVVLESETPRDVWLLAGAKSRVWVRADGEKVFRAESPRPARMDRDTVRLHLKGGETALLLKVDNSHDNLGPTFFGGPGWGWGFFARVVDPATGKAPPVRARIAVLASAALPRLRSTFFFRQGADTLLQRFDLWVNSRTAVPSAAVLTLENPRWKKTIRVRPIRYGRNRLECYLPAVATDTPVEATLSAGGQEQRWRDTLRAERRYEMHLMLLTHMDIGYTHPQPVTAELHVKALQEVLELCRTEPEFRWTVETLWQLEQFVRARPASSRDEVFRRIREGRIALSPLYSNPFTGWVSEEEMERSLAPAARLHRSNGVRFHGAVVNDLPGVSWRMPGLLREAGVGFLACGLNEVYQDYAMQRTLPKAFLWEGPDGVSTIVYRNETYSEGMQFGLEHDTTAIALRLWSRLLNLRATGNDRRLVLVNAGFLDNGPPAKHQFQTARAWNTHFRFPRFVFATIDGFADSFSRVYRDSLPVLKGDWTSAWDIQFQGEPARVRLQRWTQHQLVTAATLASLAYLRDSVQIPFTDELAGAYRMLLTYSGHGSGLEAGYGTRAENLLTMDYRERYVRDAALAAQDVLLRSMTRLAGPEESLEGEGLLVFNPLPWMRDIPVDVERKGAAGSVVLSDGLSAVDVHGEGTSLRLVARAVPPMGYRKLFFRVGKPAGPVDSLVLLQDGVQNRYYTVRANPVTGGILSLVDRRTGRELVDTAAGEVFGALHVARPFAGMAYAPLRADSVTIQVLDRRPVSVTLRMRRKGHLSSETRITLWQETDRVDMVQAVDLERLSSPETAEEYSVAFPFAMAHPEIHAELLGGFAGENERLPGSVTDGFSIRRVCTVSGQNVTVLVSMSDNRVIFWRQSGVPGRKVLFANVVNNFPVSWNRNEPNRGVLEYRFSLSSHEGSFAPGRASRFGWETVLEPAVRATWLRSSDPARGFLSVESEDVVLTGMVPEQGGGVVLRLQNMNRSTEVPAVLRSGFFSGRRAWLGDSINRRQKELGVTGESVHVSLTPGASVSVFVE